MVIMSKFSSIPYLYHRFTLCVKLLKIGQKGEKSDKLSL